MAKSQVIDCRSIFIIDDVELANKIKKVIAEHEGGGQNRDGEDTPPKPPKPEK